MKLSSPAFISHFQSFKNYFESFKYIGSNSNFMKEDIQITTTYVHYCHYISGKWEIKPLCYFSTHTPDRLNGTAKECCCECEVTATPNLMGLWNRVTSFGNLLAVSNKVKYVPCDFKKERVLYENIHEVKWSQPVVVQLCDPMDCS